MEAIWVITENDDIVPRIMWCLGFPNGPGAAHLALSFRGRLHAHPRFGTWRDHIRDVLYAMKNFRNDTVHNGFRWIDVSRKTLEEFDQLAVQACGRVQEKAKSALLAGLGT